MAITITSTSPITGSTGTYAVNNPTFDSRLQFTHASANLYYMVFVKKDNTSYYLKETGKLSGYNNISNYQYKFDFDRFINFNNQIDNEDLTGVTYGYQYYGYNSNSIALCYSTGSTFYSANVTAGNLTVQSNGDVIIASGKSYTGMTGQDGYCLYSFLDKETTATEYAIITTDLRAYRNSYFPVITCKGYKLRTTMTPDSGSNIVTTYASSTVQDYILNIAYIPANIKTFKWEIMTDISGPTSTGATVSTLCEDAAYHYYFLNSKSNFDVVHFDGTKNIIDTVEKESIKLKNKQVILNIKKTKKISQNTGYQITDVQIRDIISSPFIYTFESNKLKQYTCDNDNFTGFEGINLGGKNIELVLTDPKEYVRKTSTQISFFD